MATWGGELSKRFQIRWGIVFLGALAAVIAIVPFNPKFAFLLVGTYWFSELGIIGWRFLGYSAFISIAAPTAIGVYAGSNVWFFVYAGSQFLAHVPQPNQEITPPSWLVRWSRKTPLLIRGILAGTLMLLFGIPAGTVSARLLELNRWLAFGMVIAVSIARNVIWGRLTVFAPLKTQVWMNAFFFLFTAVVFTVLHRREFAETIKWLFRKALACLERARTVPGVAPFRSND